MTKLVSVSGLVLFVTDLSKATDFYEKVGFIFKDKTPDYAKAYLNWFWIEFVPFEKAEPSLFQKINSSENVGNKGAGAFIHISVDNVDEMYKKLTEKGLKPSSEPRTFSWGRREFVLRDPDGYKLVFFAKK